jgi:hypothetical protein
MPLEPERFSRARSKNTRPIADSDHAVNRRLPRAIGNGAKRAGDVMKPHRHGTVLPRIIEPMTPIRREHDLDAQPLRRVVECAELIASGVTEQEQSRQSRTSNLQPLTSNL